MSERLLTKADTHAAEQMVHFATSTLASDCGIDPLAATMLVAADAAQRLAALDREAANEFLTAIISGVGIEIMDQEALDKAKDAWARLAAAHKLRHEQTGGAA